MATSLKTLRRYEKVGLIILGVVVMFFFTVDISLFTGGKSGQQGGGSELKGVKYVTWRGGALTHGQLEQISFDHRSVIDVEQEIQRICNLDKKNPWNSKVEPILPIRSEQDLARRYILASYANSIGLTVDDEAVISFLVKFGGGALDRSDIKSVLDETIGDTPEARTRFFSWMRRELAAKAVLKMVNSSQTGIAPQAAWEQFKKVTQEAQIEFLALQVNDYVDKVKEKPSESELKSLYEKLKDEYRLAKYPDNGVKHLEEVAFEWVKADFESFVKEEMKNVTEEQVKEFYDKNKIRYLVPAKPPVMPATDEAPKPEGDAAEKEGAKTEEKPGETPPATPEGVEKPTERPTGTPAETPKEPSKETPKEEPAKPAADPPKQDAPSDDPKDSADEFQISVISNQEPPQGKEPKAPEGGAQEAKPTSEKPTEEKPAATEPAQDEKGKEKAPEGEKPEETPANQKKTEEKPGDAKPADAKPAQDEFKPLMEVAEDIRRELASPKADQRYKDALKNAEAELRAFWKEVNLGDGKIDQQALKRFDLETFAAKHHLTQGVIPLNPPDIAATYDELGKFPGFINQAYGETTMLYEPRSITNPYGFSLDAYIYWRTEQKDSYLPQFEECREDLEKAYRYKKAKELAAKDAKDKAAEVKPGKSLKETFPKDSVLITGHFTYMTRSPYSSGVSRIPEIERVDEKFMQAVFNLKPFQATSITIDDESASYVIYLANYKFNEPELKKKYETYPFIQELAQSANAEEEMTRRASVEEFMTALEEQYPASVPDEE